MASTQAVYPASQGDAPERVMRVIDLITARPDVSDEPRRLVGGRAIPIASLGTSTLVISGDSVIRYRFGADGEEFEPIKSTIRVDPTSSPKQMDDDIELGLFGLWISRHLGIYDVDGDKLTLCYDNEGKQRPTSLTSPPDSSFVLTVLRRQGK